VNLRNELRSRVPFGRSDARRWVQRSVRPAIRRARRAALQQAEPAHLLHIGKTGGTAMKDALRPVRTAGRYELLLHGHGTRLNNIPVGEPVFFVIRDPVERYVSGFNSRLREGRPRYLLPWTPLEKVVFERYPSADSLGRALSNEDPLERRRAAAAMMSLQHVRDSYWDWFRTREYFQRRLPDVLMIMWVPDLTHSFPQLREALGLPATVVLPNDDVRAHRTPTGADRSLSDLAQENLERWYARDYVFLELCADSGRFVGPSYTRPSAILSATAP
jgi:hypothetical protein